MWALAVISLTPAVMRASGQSIEAAVGYAERWLVPLPPGICLLALALFPIDAHAIRVVCATIIVVSTAIGTLSTLATLSGHRPAAVGFPIASLLFTYAAALASTLRCRGDRALQPRPALRRLWAVNRLNCLGLGAIYAGSSIADYVQGGSNYDHSSYAAVSVAFLLCAALPTARNRSRLHRRLGRLGARGTVEEEAASVAALVGGSDPNATLERAAKLLRCLPASRLHAADLADKSTASSDGPTLHARTEPAAMGEVTAFLSHSWSDGDEAPGAKHALVSRWASLRHEATGEEPTLWLVTLAHSYSSLCTSIITPRTVYMHTLGEGIRAPRPLPHAQDKACIDQNNIKQLLACLPVFLAGCQTLLVVAGPTYCSRLWCVMELFTFARSKRLAIHIRTSPDRARARLSIRSIPHIDRIMIESVLARELTLTRCPCVCVTVGGDQGRVEIHLIAHPEDDQKEARRLLTKQFATFDAAKARCFLVSDREHLLAVIEAGFGDFDDFNRIARNLFASRLHDDSLRLSLRKSSRLRLRCSNPSMIVPYPITVAPRAA